MLDNRLDPDSVILPKERVKNKRAHVVPLAPMAKDILKTRARSVDRDLVFGAGTGGFSGWSKAKLQLDAAILANRRKAAEEAGGKREKVKPIEPWVLHDLRRTAATLMAEIGVQPHVIEAILNHVSGHKAGVAGIYNRNPYEAEKATALARWAEHVASLVENRKSTVTAMRQAC
jgi:integrase